MLTDGQMDGRMDGRSDGKPDPYIAPCLRQVRQFIFVPSFVEVAHRVSELRT